MDPSWVLSWPENVAVSTQDDGELVLLAPHTRLVLRQHTAGLREALCSLAKQGNRAGRCADSILATDGPEGLARWHYYLRLLAKRRLLALSAVAGGQQLATLEPTASGFTLPPVIQPAMRSSVLSRFAVLRRVGAMLIAESPLSCARVVLHDQRAAALLHALAQPLSLAELSKHLPELPFDTVASLLGLLSVGGLVSAVEEDGTTVEDSDPALRCWEFHDLLFHTRSREGRHDAPFGAVYPQAGSLEPPPALKPPPSSEVFDLYRPDQERLKRDDPPFAQVQEERRSLRRYAAEPMGIQQLGEFLFRVARVKECQEATVETPQRPVRMEFASRPFPAGGALYELELYVVVQACRGLAPGLYHYDPRGHRVGRLPTAGEEVERLLADAALAAGMAAADLQVLLILSTRLPRLSWKYAGLPYALTLKHVGVVFQTMYLAATAMGLAPCALGAGNSDLFAQATDLDYYAETSVGEFLLGSKG